MKRFAIGSLSKLTGVKVPTIRFYEKIGLLPAAERTDTNRRTYDDGAVRRLGFIRHARELGFELDAVRELLDLGDQSDRSSKEIGAVARRHLADVIDRMARLDALRIELSTAVERSESGLDGPCGVTDAFVARMGIPHGEN